MWNLPIYFVVCLLHSHDFGLNATNNIEWHFKWHQTVQVTPHHPYSLAKAWKKQVCVCLCLSLIVESLEILTNTIATHIDFTFHLFRQWAEETFGFISLRRMACHKNAPREKKFVTRADGVTMYAQQPIWLKYKYKFRFGHTDSYPVINWMR